MARTWGQIRQILRQRFPSLGMDLLTSAIVTAYNDILDRQDWTQLEVSGFLRTLPRVDAVGNVTKGSITITGDGFLPDWVGRWVQIGASSAERYRILEFSLLDILLDRPYSGETATTQPLMIYQPIYSLPLDAKSAQAFPTIRERWTRAELQENGTVNAIGEPCAWIPIEADESQTLQVELYPAPVNGASFPYRYIKSAKQFDGTNTQEYPLPWVSGDAILAKATAECCVEPSIGKDPSYYLVQFRQYMERMTTQDGARAPKKLRMATRLTRHDRERQSR